MVFIAQEILDDHASYPTKRIAIIATASGRGAGLFEPRQPDYDGRAAVRFGRSPRTVRRNHRAAARAACHTSTDLAAAVGPFEAYERTASRCCTS